ncbi:hypothetical protein EAF00_003392 [Botryotinia globosa]|nr:hypothetical protein EAF00_003392 [Botryotinia globosa]
MASDARSRPAVPRDRSAFQYIASKPPISYFILLQSIVSLTAVFPNSGFYCNLGLGIYTN